VNPVLNRRFGGLFWKIIYNRIIEPVWPYQGHPINNGHEFVFGDHIWSLWTFSMYSLQADFIILQAFWLLVYQVDIKNAFRHGIFLKVTYYLVRSSVRQKIVPSIGKFWTGSVWTLIWARYVNYYITSVTWYLCYSILWECQTHGLFQYTHETYHPNWPKIIRYVTIVLFVWTFQAEFEAKIDQETKL